MLLLLPLLLPLPPPLLLRPLKVHAGEAGPNSWTRARGQSARSYATGGSSGMKWHAFAEASGHTDTGRTVVSNKPLCFL